MPMYHVQGRIMFESTREEAEYEFVHEWPYKPSDADVLDYMIMSGELQIIHEFSDELED